jgi:hypothetical protein
VRGDLVVELERGRLIGTAGAPQTEFLSLEKYKTHDNKSYHHKSKAPDQYIADSWASLRASRFRCCFYNVVLFSFYHPLSPSLFGNAASASISPLA